MEEEEGEEMWRAEPSELFPSVMMLSGAARVRPYT
jgi:hypothetical protein